MSREKKRRQVNRPKAGQGFNTNPSKTVHQS